MWEDLKDIRVLLLAFVVFFIIAATAVSSLLYIQCSHQASLYELSFRWGPLVGCNFRFGDKWIPYERYIAMEQIKR